MPVITMNVPCYVSSIGSLDAFGQPRMTAKRKTKCAVIRLEIVNQHSTVRADSASTKGHADDMVAHLHILVSSKEAIGINDTVQVRGNDFLINSYRLRFDALGRADHIELKGKIKV